MSDDPTGPGGGGDVSEVPDFVSALPPKIWYLSKTGQDMWCRRPYGFFFSTPEAAQAFAAAYGTDHDLVPIGLESREIISAQGLAALRQLQLTRIFIDPQIDPDSGEVFGTILRLAEPAPPS